MALLFMDSFDHYAQADITEKWATRYTAGGLHAQTQIGAFGRRSSGGFRATAVGTNASGRTAAIGVTRTPTGATCVVGFSFTTPDFSPLSTNTNYDPSSAAVSSAPGILAIRLAGTTHVAFVLNQAGTITAYRGSSGTVLGTTSVALNAGVTAYLEFTVTINDTTGVVIVRKDGAVILNLSPIDTNNGVANAWDEIIIGRIAATGLVTWDYDDLYVLDGSGPAPLNDFLGDVRVDPCYPSAPGATTGWTPSAAPNWSCVDDAAPNDDTDYVGATAAPATDTYTLQDAPVVGGTLYGVQLLWNIKKLDAGTCSVAPVVRQGTTNLAGTVQNPGTAYGYQSQVYGTNPHTSAAWTESDFNANEFGLERTA